MFETLQKALDRVADVIKQIDPETLAPAAAVALLNEFSRGERLCAAGKALSAKRVESSGTWRTSGERSAASFIAKQTGETLGVSARTLETAKRLEDLPKTLEAFRSGDLSPAQASEIASAAAVAPQAEAELLEIAKTNDVNELRQACQRSLATSPGQADRAERLHRSRYLRTWTDQDGAFRMDARLAPDQGAKVRAVLDKFREKQFQVTRKQGVKESYGALESDALVAMSDAALTQEGAGPGSRPMVLLRVDLEALRRGELLPGEVSGVAGVGPISIEAANGMLSDSNLKILWHKRSQVEAVTTVGRTIPASVRAALLERDTKCVVSGCAENRHLEIDHVVPFAAGGPSSLENLVRLCRHHHKLKTYKGFKLQRDGTRWKLLAPHPALAP